MIFTDPAVEDAKTMYEAAREYLPFIRSHVPRHLVDDTFADCVHRAWEKYALEGKIIDHTALRQYMYKIVYFCCLENRRKNHQDSKRNISFESEYVSETLFTNQTTTFEEFTYALSVEQKKRREMLLKEIGATSWKKHVNNFKKDNLSSSTLHDLRKKAQHVLLSEQDEVNA